MAGPKTFYIVSDPVVAKHVLRTANLSFDKGVLAEILAPIMGTGLIPADFETWRTRRKALVPGFHSAWLSHMMGLFAHCTQPAIETLNAAADTGSVVDMEALFCSLSLDIIGLSVFNYGFGSIRQESPIIRAVYNVLREAEHRSTFYFPYWNIPGADLVRVPVPARPRDGVPDAAPLPLHRLCPARWRSKRTCASSTTRSRC